MTRIEALQYAIGLLNEHAYCGNDQSAVASEVLNRMLTGLIRQKAKHAERNES